MQPVEKEVLQEAVILYGVTGELKRMTDGFQNKVYSYRKNNEELILRITPANKKNKRMIEEEINWINFLADNGVSVSSALPSINNQLVETVTINNQNYVLASFIKAEGSPVDVTDRQTWNERLFEEWGRMLGNIHHGGKMFRAQNGKLYRPQWEISEPCNHKIFKNIQQEWLAKKYRSITEQLMTFSRDTSQFGMIHNDFHQGNFFVSEGKITLFDFDDGVHFWFAYDIATSFYHAYWQHSSFNGQDDQFTMDFLKNILKGYAEENTVTVEFIDQLPIFLKLREMFLYLLFLEKWDQTSLEGWQEYTLSSLKHAIEKDAVYAGLTGDRLLKLKQYI